MGSFRAGSLGARVLENQWHFYVGSFWQGVFRTGILTDPDGSTYSGEFSNAEDMGCNRTRMVCGTRVLGWVVWKWDRNNRFW